MMVHRFQPLIVLSASIWMATNLHRHPVAAFKPFSNTKTGSWKGGPEPTTAASGSDEVTVDFTRDGDGSNDSNDSNDDESNSSSNKTNSTLEDYVAAMKEKDQQGRGSVVDNLEPNDANDETPEDQADPSSAEDSSPKASPSKDSDADDTAAVGVKSHKKSNAVGDPDGDDDDDDDDDDEPDEDGMTSDFSEEWEELDEINRRYHEDQQQQQTRGYTDGYVLDPDVQVEVEVMEGVSGSDEEEDATTETATTGGVGIRLGRSRANNRNPRRNSEWTKTPATTTDDEARLLKAWMSHVYLPPTTQALDYLADQGKLLEAASKARLDRRTLYASLLQEWGCVGTPTKTKSSSAASPSSKSGGSRGSRKFLLPSTSQALQAAVSIATQPHWRYSSPRTNGITLYASDEKGKSMTLSMQETVAMSLAHSMGCGMLILDDQVITSVRQKMSKLGVTDDRLKPAALLQGLLNSAKKGKLCQPSQEGGSISACMKRDLAMGLDDPFDDRATLSLDDMLQWEEEWNTDDGKLEEPLSLVIFIRTSASNSLLKSKSAMELLIQECTSEDSIHLVTLGKGIDSSTAALPSDEHRNDEVHQMQDLGPGRSPMNNNNIDGQGWFGFSPQNQNASGQNDPEGSRRFNIFLARTADSNGQPGIFGAIAPPQAGNLFPHMMAMQAREKLKQQHDDDSPAKAELERWAHMLEQQQHMLEPPDASSAEAPQFFNASLSSYLGPQTDQDGQNIPPPPPEVIEQTLQQAMSELLDRLADMNDEAPPSEPSQSNELSPDLHRAFAQVLRNENLRRGIAENLARAAPALSDPKCQGVMLSVYVPPPATHMNKGKMPIRPNPKGQQGSNMGGWFNKIMNSQEQEQKKINQEDESDDEASAQNHQKRVRTMAAAAAVLTANNAQGSKGSGKSSENKAERNLAKLESICRPILVGVPSDPVRAKSWDSWIGRERGSVLFRINRQALNQELSRRNLALEQHTGTRGAGSALRQMLSVRDLTSDMEEVIRCAVELEAAKSLRKHESPDSVHTKDMNLDIDVSLSQLILNEDGSVDSSDKVLESVSVKSKDKERGKDAEVRYLHPSSLESALTMKSQISPSPSGGLSLSGTTAAHRTREEIAALAQDKHERALVSQVASPQDIGVTYDMIGGLFEVKELLRQSITYPLKFPHLYSEGIAREAVKGVLLFGPPGTGKTMLAKAVATEGGASFLSVDASSVENKWLGESEKNAKAVFTLARRLAPCVIFIDEVDSLLSSREGSSDDSAHGTLTSVKTTMMSEWDGLNSGTNGNGEAGSDRVVVIGSTNRPFDLDEAVLRRFPRRILVDLPDMQSRKEILEVTLAENRVSPAVNLTDIAERLEGYTGSDIKEVCREAVVQISHEQAKLLDQGFLDLKEDVTEGSLQRLRPVTNDDFESALNKLKRSVSEKGRELARVWEWNDEYGEIKKEKTNKLPHLMNMYL